MKVPRGRVVAGTANRVRTETCLDKDSPVPAELQRHTDAPRVQLEMCVHIDWGRAIQRSYQLFSINVKRVGALQRINEHVCYYLDRYYQAG